MAPMYVLFAIDFAFRNDNTIDMHGYKLLDGCLLNAGCWVLTLSLSLSRFLRACSGWDTVENIPGIMSYMLHFASQE
jgi:hypothetical protein